MAQGPHDPNDTHLRPEGAKALRPRDAATLVLYRRAGRTVEVVMGERHGKHAFMPNQWVFPGGRVDPTDWRIRSASELKPHVSGHLLKGATPSRARALAAAAIRETFEETGLILGKPDPNPDRTVPANWKEFFATGFAPDLEALDYVARAITPPFRPRRFNARFFMCDADRLANEVIESSGELLDIHWVSIDRAMSLPIPRITGVMLKFVEDFVENPPPATPEHPMPLYRYLHGKHMDIHE
ncbi:MAG: NUDIX domain-containing protein [Pseudomonadota bacterium]|nr:NUDIX domain-containing protein [Pseudomonadota bacterium]